MSAVASYAPSPIRRRRSKYDMELVRNGLIEILEDEHPMSVRQVFYQAVTHDLVDKTEGEYKQTVVRLLSELRRSRVIPFDYVADSTRWMRKPRTHASMEAALQLTAQTYRRALWLDSDVVVEIWLEKDALAGVLYPITAEYDVPLMVTRGYPSLTFVQGAAAEYESADRGVFIYYFGDWDPSGRDISRVVEQGLREWAPNTNIVFTRVAVNESQIVEWQLPTRPTKTSDTRSKSFQGESVEVDAIAPDDLRYLARVCIESHLNQEILAAHQATEDLERETLQRFVETFRGAR